MPQVRKATEYAVRLSNCATLIELRALWSEITANRNEVSTLYSWLCDFKDSRKWILNDKDDPNFFSKEGKEWLKKRGISQ